MANAWSLEKNPVVDTGSKLENPPVVNLGSALAVPGAKLQGLTDMSEFQTYAVHIPGESLKMIIL